MSNTRGPNRSGGISALDSIEGERTKELDGSSISRNVELRKTLIGPGSGGLGLQVVIGEWTGSGSPNTEIKTLHSHRLGKKIFPLVVALSDSTGATWIMGPSSDATPVGPIAESQAARILQAGLDEPSGIKGRQRIAALLRSFQTTEVAGMTNSGLFATHFLTEGVKQTPMWAVAAEESKPWLALRGERLVSAMGYSARRAASAAHVLTTAASNEPRAIAVLLSDQESFDSASARFAVSPVAFGLNLAQREGAEWLMVLRGSQIRLYPAKPGVGVGSRGLAETFFELDLALVSEEDGGFLGMVFSANALQDQGSINLLLEGSSRYAAGLGERLRKRVYDQVVPGLAVAVADSLPGGGTDLDLAYRVTLRILFRLLFQAYAEDRGLLPYNRNDRYTRNSLKRWARDFVEQPHLVEELDAESHAIWDDLCQVWGVIDTGNRTWDVPAYNGGLFGADPEFHPEGALIEGLQLDDMVIGKALRHLLVDETSDGVLGPVDFRSLSVREFGTIYEGLLESSLSKAGADLTIDKKQAYVPAGKGDTVVVPAGFIYFHNKSGERKATGSYFTPSFAVAHLLERALEPTLSTHLDGVAALLEAGDQAGAQERFFDFRVADLAMGSGHFLVAAIDTIEAGMSAFLTVHNLPGITDELHRLEQAAREALGDDEVDYEIEPSALLRRQIARRCIYGLDLNEIAVELARVGIWIHTFVPGLPMSSLDHNLVCANSLTGIGTLDEALDALEPKRKKGTTSILTAQLEETLDNARQLLIAAGNTAEATKAEVAAAAQAAREAAVFADSAKLIFDAAVAARTGLLGDLRQVLLADEVIEMANDPVSRSEVATLQPGHMPYLFPEVFLRDNPGFDCVLGNPPWEKLKVEEHAWWGLRFPGLRGLSQRDKNTLLKNLKASRPDLVAEYESDVATASYMRAVIATGPYPGVGRGDIDLYQAFAWRFWQLLRVGGSVGVVLPRSALSGSGTTKWREDVLNQGSFVDVCLLHNQGRWMFDMDERKTLALVTISRVPGRSVAFSGPFSSLADYVAGHADRTAPSVSEFRSWSDTLSFPTVPSGAAGEILRLMKKHPRFDSDEGFEFRPIAELHATNDRKLFDTNLSRAGWSMPVLTGASFEIWDPDFGDPYGVTDPKKVIAHLIAKARKGANHSSSAFNGMTVRSAQDHPISRARITFRDIATRTNQRSAIFCLIPPGSTLVHQAPYLLRRSGDENDEAYLLAVASSIPFDWYIRRWVENHLTFELLAPAPVPRTGRSDPLRARLVEVSGRLAAVDERFQEWAMAVGVPLGTLRKEPDRSEAIAEIDALVSHLYGLSWDHVQHIFETFHRGWNNSERLAAVKRYYDQWSYES